jgi:hypothetical protein
MSINKAFYLRGRKCHSPCLSWQVKLHSDFLHPQETHSVVWPTMTNRENGTISPVGRIMRDDMSYRWCWNPNKPWRNQNRSKRRAITSSPFETGFWFLQGLFGISIIGTTCLPSCFVCSLWERILERSLDLSKIVKACLRSEPSRAFTTGGAYLGEQHLGGQH